MDNKEIRGWLLDIEGVVLNGPSVLSDNVAFIQSLMRENKPILFVTNTVSQPKNIIVERLAYAGLAVTPEHILTPVDVACYWLLERNIKNIFVIAPESIQSAFSQFQLRSPGEALILGDFGLDWTYARLNEAFNWMMKYQEQPVLALGGGRYYRRAETWFLDLGAFTQALTWASEHDILNCGKPSPLIFDIAARKIQIDKTNLVMVGDDWRSDVNAAMRAGCQGVLVKSGKYRPGDETKLISGALCVESLSSF